jgi:hypothetical protein
MSEEQPKKGWVARQRDEARRTVETRGRKLASFGGVTLYEQWIDAGKEGSGSVAGAKATVDTAGALNRRMTATRLVLTGPLALAWRKKKDDRELYLLIESASFAASVPVEPKKGKEARSFAARITTQGLAYAGPGVGGDAAEPAEGSDPDPAGTLLKLKQLLDAGAITEAEFEAKKADLLGRI